MKLYTNNQIFTQNGHFVYFGEAHSGKRGGRNTARKNRGRPNARISGHKDPKRLKTSKHTDYRSRGDWTESDVHSSEREMAPHVESFVKRHKRMPRIDEIVSLFDNLQCSDYEAHTNSECALEWDKMQEIYKRFVVELKTRNLIADTVLDLLENVFSTFWILGKCTTTTDVISVLLLFVKATLRPSESFTTMFAELITSCFEPDVMFEDGKPTVYKAEAHAGWEPAKLLNAWRQGAQNPLFEKLTFVVSFLVSAGLVKERLLTVGNFKLFKAEALRAGMHCGDIVDGLLGTIVFFFEKGYQCFTERSFSPLWRATSELNEFDDKVAFLVANIINVKNGNLMARTGTSDNKFESIIDECKTKVKQLIETAPDKTMRTLMLQKRITIDKIYTEFHNYVASSGMREAPFCVCLYGKSAVGKTSLTTTLMTALLKINKYECTDDFICNIQDTDKYMSTYKSHMTGAVLDDMCNTRAANAQVNPTARIIEMMNNVRVYANMADVDRKGSTFVQPKVVVITTNSVTLDAGFWSVEPVSVLRRIHVRVVVEVLPQYATMGKLDSNKVALHYPDQAAPIKDLWKLELQYLEPIPDQKNQSGAEGWKWTTYVHEGKELKGINIFETIKFLGSQSKKHFTQQRDLVHMYTNFGLKYDLCSECCSIGSCSCIKKEVAAGEAHSIRIIEDWSHNIAQMIISIIFVTGTTLFREFTRSFFPRAVNTKVIARMSTTMLLGIARVYAYSPFAWWSKFVPDEVVRTKEFGRFYYWSARWRMGRIFLRLWIYAQLLLLLACLGSAIVDDTRVLKIEKHWLPFGILNVFLSAYWTHTKIAKELALRRGVHDIYRLKTGGRLTLSNVVRFSAYATTGAIVFCVVRALWCELRRQFGSDPHAQTTINPTTDEEIKARNDTANPWMQRVSPRPVKIGTCQTMTSTDLQRVVERGNLVYISYREPNCDNRFGTDAIYVKSNIIMMPYHVWFENSDIRTEPRTKLVFDIVRAEENLNGGWCARNVEVHFVNTVRVGSTDLLLAYVPSGGVRSDITHFFPEERLVAPIGAICSYRHKDGTVMRFNADFSPGNADYINPFGSRIHIAGGIARYNVDTFRGMCMSPLFAEYFPTHIIGFHLAGKTGSPMGSVGSITRDDLQNSLVLLRTTPGYVEAHSAGELPLNVLGKSIGFSPTIDIRSPISYIDQYNADIYGSCAGGTSPTTKVIPSLIAPILSGEYNIEQKWAGPQYRPQGRKYKPWYDTLIHLVEPRHKLDPNLLEAARKDYVNGFLKYFSLEELMKYLGPLCMDDNVNGIPGVKFIDGVNLSTSIGFPLSGPKSEYIVDMYPEPVDGRVIRSFVESLGLQQAMKECEDDYIKGIRCHHIFKACLKDEPTSIYKDKVRVFEAAPITLQLLIRKYYLPVIRFMSMLPTVSECAVGINCYGMEWAEMHEHIAAFGDETILAGDYSKWDLKLPAQLVMIAFDIMIRIARMSGKYTEQDIVVMQGIATDVAYPVIAFNGTLLELHGSNPSGQNLTAHLNSICNSILLRMGFFHLTGKNGDFREWVHAYTYGDDLISGVHRSLPQFNHVTYAKFLRDIEIDFTMPDKVSEPKPYLHIAEVDFLKRKSVFNTDFMRYVGQLDIDSINKSLMNQRKTNKELLKSAMRSTIQSALHELVLHGEDKYNEYAEMLRNASNQLQMVLPELDITYEERVVNWHIKYGTTLDDLEYLPDGIASRVREALAAQRAPVVGSVPDDVFYFDF